MFILKWLLDSKYLGKIVNNELKKELDKEFVLQKKINDLFFDPNIIYRNGKNYRHQTK